jgi:hypothetical protein
MQLIIIVMLGIISYTTLRKSNLIVFTKVAWSAVSVSVFFVGLLVSSELVPWLSNYIENRPSMEFQTIVNSAGWILALIGWIIFWRAQAKSLSKK